MRVFSLFFVFSLAACAASSTPAPLRHARPLPKPTPKATASAASTQSPAEAPAALDGSPSEESASARGFYLFAEGTAALTVVPGPRTVFYAGETIWEVVGDDVRALHMSLPVVAGAGQAAGLVITRFPDRVFSTAFRPEPRIGERSVLVRLGASGAVDSALGLPMRHMLAASSMGELIVYGNDWDGSRSGMPEDEQREPEVTAWTTDPNGASFADEAMTRDVRSPNKLHCNSRMLTPDMASSSPDGTIFVIGHECAGGATILGVTEPSGAHRTIPLAKFEPVGSIAALSPKRVYIRGLDLVVFDGSKFTPIPKPLEFSGNLFLSRAGNLWSIDDTVAWRQTASGFTRVDLPPNGALVPPAFDDDLWFLSKDKKKVFRSRKPAKVARLTELTPAAPNALTFCPTLFVQIAAISASTPDKYDFPATRAALAGHPELGPLHFVVTNDNRWGVSVQDTGTAEKLLTLLNAKLTSKPQLLCHVPDVKREVSFDLATGKPR